MLINTDSGMSDALEINAFSKAFLGMYSKEIPDDAEAFTFYIGNIKDITMEDTV